MKVLLQVILRILIFTPILFFAFTCKKGPSISKEEVQKLSKDYFTRLCTKTAECASRYLETLPASEKFSENAAYSVDQCMEEQKDQNILPDEYEKVTDAQIAKVKVCMEDLLKVPCEEMEGGGIPSCQELFQSSKEE
ncbi:hypothetical protein LEP1GSC161_2796 [Leptospira santarosai str. CBC1416]|uniref:Uncharacterized protein n=2 Tax=Leptospira santarosai TaxID=28183 RepID=M6UPH9_9LEPT|nr:hypothetical protein [Leptospira santarosai]EMO56812.1 hypothetical protein LEP1GSC161_2796 [Leptospira santarosai str. CBC1416]EMO15198.1 hypothetical protein LEP1GSC165_0931 [Leptospira santarosai str. CBC523]EMO34150.1 hypothetical protein LEP1GSC175_1864 [Leptospira santarosai str. HAI821]EMO46490.1 hypothetical protein LEP1GSC187_1324 [Leptospira santarosai str. ZUN179]EMO84773.1 hypothetical protein LEP1GSC070_2176 [Leptospira santarosai str. AIM]